MHTQWMTERTKLKLRPPCISRHKLLPVSVKHTYNLRLVRKWWGRERLISTQACSTGTKVIIITNEHARTRTHTHTQRPSGMHPSDKRCGLLLLQCQSYSMVIAYLLRIPEGKRQTNEPGPRQAPRTANYADDNTGHQNTTSEPNQKNVSKHKCLTGWCENLFVSIHSRIHIFVL